MAPRRAVCQQPDRSRPQPAQTPAAPDARAAHRPNSRCRHRWTRLHPEPSTRPLRTGPRRTASLAGRHSVYRTRPGDLTGEPDHATTAPIGRDNATAPDETGRRLGKAKLADGIVGIARLHAMIGEHVDDDDGPVEVVVGIETDRG